MSRITRALLALALLALAAPAGAAAAPTLVPVGTFGQPVYATSPPQDARRLFVVEKAGIVRIVRDGATLPTAFLDISGEVASAPTDERGLLSMAFPDDYETSGRFFVYMTARPLGDLQVREYHRSAADPDRADPNARIVWSAAHAEAPNHNGGQIAWGPDGKLWFATGDGGGSNNQYGHARDLSSPLGKLLRIDPNPGNAGSFTIPADNPFVNRPGARGEIYAYGLRNPFRFSFDHRGSKDLFIGDVGQATREEVDWVRSSERWRPGADYGWQCREGDVRTPGVAACDPDPAAYVPPVFDYDSTTGSHSVAGGVIVHDPGLPTLNGRYVYADTYDGIVRSFVPDSARASDAPAGLPRRGTIVAFGEDACGHVYVVSLEGSVDRIQDGEIGSCVLRIPAAPAPVPPKPVFPDRTSPRVRIEIARKGRVGRRATPRIQLTATEACRVTIRARLAGTTFKRVRTPLRGGRRTIVRLRPKAKSIKRIHRALRRHRRATLIVSVTAVDAAGNTGRVQRRLKVRRG